MSKKNDTALRFYNEVLGLERLHYGLWQEDDDLTVAKLKEAQLRYENFLINKIPGTVQTILDVGCGTGILTKNLLEAGYKVEGLSPDINQKNNFIENINAPFHHLRFEKFSVQNKFDLLIMSESSQYIKKKYLFENAKKALKVNGYLMVCDYFVLENVDNNTHHSGHNYQKFTTMAIDAGFTLVEEIEITDRVLNTLLIGKEFVSKALLTFDIFTQKIRMKHSYLSKFTRWVFRKKIAKLMKQIELLDTEIFKATKTYRFLLYQIKKW